jgi:DNA modification methylase
VLVFKNGREPHRGRSGHRRTDIWDYPGRKSSARNSKAADLFEAHPAPKPIRLVADALVDCTACGDIVLDSFVGSGTTLLAAERVARVCYGMENDPVCVDASIRRWQSATGLSATRISSGRSFDELEREAENRHE